MLRSLLELSTLIAFFVGYKYGGIITATVYMLIATGISLAVSYYMDGKIQTMALVSAVVLLISSVLTLLSGNTIFVKMKPTVVYLIFSIILFISAIRNIPISKYLFAKMMILDNKYWVILNYRFAIYFVIMAVINELVWRNFDEAIWVKFKVFGAFPLIVVFILLQIPFLMKHKMSFTKE